MELHQFNGELNRLADTFPRSYPDERVKLLWRQFGSQDISVFRQAVDALILGEKFPPMADKISAAVWRVKEKRRFAESATVQEVDDVVCTFSIEEQKVILKTICDRMHRKVNDAEWNSFFEVLDNAAKASELKSNVER